MKTYLMIVGYTAGVNVNPPKVGEIAIDFADGRSFVTDLILKENIRGWTNFAGGDIPTFSSTSTRMVYQGNSRFGPGVVDMLQFDIPEDHQVSEIILFSAWSYADRRLVLQTRSGAAKRRRSAASHPRVPLDMRSISLLDRSPSFPS